MNWIKKHALFSLLIFVISIPMFSSVAFAQEIPWSSVYYSAYVDIGFDDDITYYHLNDQVSSPPDTLPLSTGPSIPSFYSNAAVRSASVMVDSTSMTLS